MTPVYTVLALVSFAANSILCRLALGSATIDPASFTTVRLVSGAALLVAITRTRPRKPSGRRQKSPAAWRSAAVLFLYAIAFSYAYVSLSTGTGALILFGAVQMTILATALISGERPSALEWTALVSAITGLIVLVFPSLTAPPVVGSVMMTIAGVSWGLYTLWGRNIDDPLDATTTNFVRALPLTIMASGLAFAWVGRPVGSTRGVVLAVSSGAVTSALGYIFWYGALPRLSATQAALVQLPVPLMAALGGVVFMSESITVRLVVAAVLILGGVGAATVGGAIKS